MKQIALIIIILISTHPALSANQNRTDQRLVALSAIIKNIEGIKTRVTGGKIVIEGEILREEDNETIKRLTKQHRTIVNLTRISPILMRIRKAELEDMARSLGYSNFQVLVMNEELIIKGTVKTDDERKEITKFFKEQSGLITPVITVGKATGTSILIDLELFEINNNDLTSGGILWPEGVRGSALFAMQKNKGDLSLAAAPINDAVVHALKNSGATRIIANPRLTCQTDEEASFLAGGEIPLTSTNHEGYTSVSYKPYGISLKIKPTLAAKDKISLWISSEISMIDHRSERGSLPGFLTRRFTTSVTVKPGIPILLTGLFNQEAGDEISSVPYLSAIPVLGELFKSKAFRERQSQLVGIMTATPQNDDESLRESFNTRKFRPFLEQPIWNRTSESQ